MNKILIPIAAILLFFGCKKEDMAGVNTPASASLTISPADNQSGVSAAADIVVTFERKIDPGAVQNNFHLISAESLADSMMPGNTMMGHMSMMSAMGNRSAMNYLDSVHSLHGSFTWNTDSTICTFDPDSLFHATTQYMIHFDQPMVDMMEQRMGSMEMMGYNGSSTETGLAFHFTTETGAMPNGSHEMHH
ncbi:MAG: Ig-like domain-containing protein [Bacteroidota bacterium]|jgi:hypothetical protein